MTTTPTTDTAPSIGTVVAAEKAWAARIAAFVASALGVITLLHPGFKLPASTQLAVTIVAFAIAFLVFVFDLFARHQLKAVIVKAWADVESHLHLSLATVDDPGEILASFEHPKTDVDKLVDAVHSLVDSLTARSGTVASATAHLGEPPAPVPTTPPPS